MTRRQIIKMWENILWCSHLQGQHQSGPADLCADWASLFSSTFLVNRYHIICVRVSEWDIAKLSSLKFVEDTWTKKNNYHCGKDDMHELHSCQKRTHKITPLKLFLQLYRYKHHTWDAYLWHIWFDFLFSFGIICITVGVSVYLVLIVHTVQHLWCILTDALILLWTSMKNILMGLLV